jgi:hypothetical protein
MSVRPEHLLSTNSFASIITGHVDDACIRPSLFLIPASSLVIFAMTGHNQRLIAADEIRKKESPPLGWTLIQ